MELSKHFHEGLVNLQIAYNLTLYFSIHLCAF